MRSCIVTCVALVLAGCGRQADRPKETARAKIDTTARKSTAASPEVTVRGRPLSQWAKALRGPNAQHSQQAADVLAQAGAPAVAVLTEALQENNENVTRNASLALVKI